MTTHLLSTVKELGCDTQNLVAHAFVSNKDRLLMAVYLEDHTGKGCLTVAYASKVDPALKWVSVHSAQPIICLSVSPCAQWILSVTSGPTLTLIETPIKNGDEILTVCASPAIKIKCKDEILGTPSSCVWFESSSHRSFAICSNKGGEILFVDLQLGKPTVSLQAPQSIHKLELVREFNMGFNNVYLLATGFTGSQWLIPLETNAMTLRETLSSVVPADLAELSVGGHVTPLFWRGSHCVSVHDKILKCLTIYHCVTLRNAVLTVPLAENTIYTHVTDDTVFCMDESNEVFAQYLFVGQDNTILNKETNLMKSLGMFGCSFIDFVPMELPCSKISHPLSSVYLLGNRQIDVLQCFKCKIEIVVNLLGESKLDDVLSGFALDLHVVAHELVDALLYKNNTALTLPMMICRRVKMPPVEVISHFGKHKKPHYALLNCENICEQFKQTTKIELFESLINCAINCAVTSEEYEKMLCVNWIRSVLINVHDSYLSLDLLHKLVDNQLWSCITIFLKYDHLVEMVAKRLLLVENWLNDDQLQNLCLHETFSQLVRVNSHLALDYFTRVLDISANFESQRHILEVLKLTNPNGNGLKNILVSHTKRLENKALLSCVAKIYLPTLCKYLVKFGAQNESISGCLLSASANHSCMLNSTGLFCWGRAKQLQLVAKKESVQVKLGNMNVETATRSGVVSNTSAGFTLPMKVPLPFSPMCVKSVVCGSEHTLLLTDIGEVYSWGVNHLGQCGVAHRNPVFTPTKVTQLNTNIAAISAGSFHSVCVDITGRVYAWGWSIYGQLGIGNTQSDPSQPVKLMNFYDPVVKICCGYAHTILLTKAGEVYVCGNGNYGQNGCGTTDKNICPTLVKIQSDSPVVDIGCGTFHCLALTSQNVLYTWGATPQSLKFKAMLYKRKKSAAKLQSGVDSCKDEKMVESRNLAITTVDSVHLLPNKVYMNNVKLKENEKIVKISCGSQHSAILTNCGEVYVWGKNLEYQLGLGDKKERDYPVNLGACINEDRTWGDISCGSDFTLAIDDQGQMYGWGRNDLAQLAFIPQTQQQKHWAAGRTFTFHKGSQGQRTIQLPQDSRTFVHKPNVISGFSTDFISVQQPVYNYAQLLGAFKVLYGNYELNMAVDWCSDESLKSVQPMIYFMHDKFAIGIKLYHKMNPGGFEMEKEIFVNLLTSLASNNKIEFCDAILALSQCAISQKDLQQLIQLNLHAWTQSLTWGIENKHGVMKLLSHQIKLNLLKSKILDYQKLSEIQCKENVCVIDVDRNVKEDNLLYLFTNCGHSFTQSKFDDISENECLKSFCYGLQGNLKSFTGGICPECIVKKLKF